MTQESHAHPRHPFRLALLSLSLLGLSGCLHYQAKPLDPQLTAQRFQQRTLDSNGLKTFLQQQNTPLPQWPLPHWNLPQLTLAARLKLNSAISIIGALSVSLLFSLLVTPSLYLLLSPIFRWKR